MRELTTDSTPGGSTPAAAGGERRARPPPPCDRCPECFEELQRNPDWWKARPEGSRLVGLVVVSERALGPTSDEIALTIRTVRRHNLVVKVLSHGAPHLEDARG